MNEATSVRIGFGDSGNNYVMEQFDCKTILTDYFLTENLKIVETFSILHPKCTSFLNYKFGACRGMDRALNRPLLVGFIRKYLQEHLKSVCIMENFGFPYLGRNVNYIDSLQSRLYFCRTIPFHVALPGDSCEKIECALLDSEIPRIYFGLLTQPNDFFVENPKARIEMQDTDLLVRNAEYIFTTAWDDEGYLIGRVEKK